MVFSFFYFNVLAAGGKDDSHGSDRRPLHTPEIRDQGQVIRDQKNRFALF